MCEAAESNSFGFWLLDDDKEIERAREEKRKREEEETAERRREYQRYLSESEKRQKVIHEEKQVPAVQPANDDAQPEQDWVIRGMMENGYSYQQATGTLDSDDSDSDEEGGEMARALERFMQQKEDQRKEGPILSKVIAQKVQRAKMAQERVKSNLEIHYNLLRQEREEHEERQRTDMLYASSYHAGMQNMSSISDTTCPDRALQLTAAGMAEEPEQQETLFMDEAQACFGSISFSPRDIGLACKALLMTMVGEGNSDLKSCVQRVDLSDPFMKAINRAISTPEFLNSLARIPRDRKTFEADVLLLSTQFSREPDSPKRETPDEISLRVQQEFYHSLQRCADESDPGYQDPKFRFNARALIALLYQNASWGNDYWNTYGMKKEGAPTVKSGRYRAISSRMGFWRPRAPTNQPWSILSVSKRLRFTDSEYTKRSRLWTLPENVERETIYPACATTYPGRTIYVVERGDGASSSGLRAADPDEMIGDGKTFRRRRFMLDMWKAFRGERPLGFNSISSYFLYEHEYYMQRPATSMDSALLWSMYALSMCDLDPVVRKLIDILLEGAATKKGCVVGGEIGNRGKLCDRVLFYSNELNTLIRKETAEINRYIAAFMNKNSGAFRKCHLAGEESMPKVYEQAVLFSNPKKKEQKKAVFFRNCLEHRVYAFFVLSQGDPRKPDQPLIEQDFTDACDELLGYVISTDINDELAEYRVERNQALRLPSMEVTFLAAAHILFPGGLPSPLDYYAPISGYITRKRETFDKRYPASRVTVGDTCYTTEPVKKIADIDIGTAYTHTNLATGTIFHSNRHFAESFRLHMHLGGKTGWSIVTRGQEIPAESKIGTLVGESHWTLRPREKERDSAFHRPGLLYPVGEYVWMCYVGQASEEWDCWMYIDGRFFSNYVRYVRYTDKREHANAKFVKFNMKKCYAQTDSTLPHVPKKGSFCPWWTLTTTKPIQPHSEILVFNPLGCQLGRSMFFEQGLCGGKKNLDIRPRDHFVRECRSIGDANPSLANHHIRLYGETLEAKAREERELEIAKTLELLAD